MAKITALPAAAAVTADDLLAIVNDPGGTPETQKATLTVLAAFLRSLAESLTNKTIDADQNTITNIENADIKAAAGIALSKIVNPTGTGVVKTTAGVIDAAASTIVNADINAAAAIALSKIVNPTGTGLVKTSAGAIAAASALLVNADVDAAAAIAGTKVSPNFGSQNTTTTGTSTSVYHVATGAITNSGTGNLDDITSTGAHYIRMTGAAPNVRGIAGGTAGRIVFLMAIGGNVTLAQEDAGSSAANRLAIQSASATIFQETVVPLIYDGTSSRWRELCTLARL